MAIFKLSGFDNEKEHVLEVTFNPKVVFVKYDRISYHPFQTDVFLKKALSYHEDNYGSGQPFFERDFLKQFDLKDKNSIDCTLLRCLAITLPFFDYSILNDYSIDNEFDTYMFRSLHFDWSGDMGTQPYIYMISHELLKKYNNSVQLLYQKGILYKYSVNSSDSYFVPFVFSDYPTLESPEENILWNLIKKEINKAILRMTRRG